jgi:hypothetical protein
MPCCANDCHFWPHSSVVAAVSRPQLDGPLIAAAPPRSNPTQPMVTRVLGEVTGPERVETRGRTATVEMDEL